MSLSEAPVNVAKEELVIVPLPFSSANLLSISVHKYIDRYDTSCLFKDSNSSTSLYDIFKSLIDIK